MSEFLLKNRYPFIIGLFVFLIFLTYILLFRIYFSSAKKESARNPKTHALHSSETFLFEVSCGKSEFFLPVLFWFFVIMVFAIEMTDETPDMFLMIGLIVLNLFLLS